LKPDKVVSIPTGVDVDYFAPRSPDIESKRALGLPDSCKVVSIVGILRRVKRHDLFLEVASVLREHDPSLRFVIAGEGPQRPNIERIIEERRLADCVTLTGHVDDVRPIFSFSDVVVLSSDAEGVPQSVAQALSMARPVVATNVGGVNELVRNETTGLLVPPNTPFALAAAIERFLTDPTFAATCGAHGREHIVRDCSSARMIERTLALYQKLVP
jgi:glycosyltransferase involved in cell wall biosynthesis